jgi:predicted MFS family arabinose efflux permease
MAAALALGALATGPTGMAATALFWSYAAFQWMTDPGINTLLMNRVREAERSGAAAMMMLAAFVAQFVASWAGGAAIARFGYPAMLACAAGLAAVAAIAFRWLPGPAISPEPAPLVAISAPDTVPD